MARCERQIKAPEVSWRQQEHLEHKFAELRSGTLVQRHGHVTRVRTKVIDINYRAFRPRVSFFYIWWPARPKSLPDILVCSVRGIHNICLGVTFRSTQRRVRIWRRRDVSMLLQFCHHRSAETDLDFSAPCPLIFHFTEIVDKAITGHRRDSIFVSIQQMFSSQQSITWAIILVRRKEMEVGSCLPCYHPQCSSCTQIGETYVF